MVLVASKVSLARKAQEREKKQKKRAKQAEAMYYTWKKRFEPSDSSSKVVEGSKSDQPTPHSTWL